MIPACAAPPASGSSSYVTEDTCSARVRVRSAAFVRVAKSPSIVSLLTSLSLRAKRSNLVPGLRCPTRLLRRSAPRNDANLAERLPPPTPLRSPPGTPRLALFVEGRDALAAVGGRD